MLLELYEIALWGVVWVVLYYMALIMAWLLFAVPLGVVSFLLELVINMVLGMTWDNMCLGIFAISKITVCFVILIVLIVTLHSLTSTVRRMAGMFPRTKIALKFPWLNPDMVCPITLERIVQPALLPCGHVFEREALDYWRRMNRTCPLCRS